MNSYRLWSGSLKQQGTTGEFQVPFPQVKFNNFIGEPSYTRNGVGDYTGTFNGGGDQLIEEATQFIYPSILSTGYVVVTWLTSNSFSIKSYSDAALTTLADSVIGQDSTNGMSFEIKVWV